MSMNLYLFLPVVLIEQVSGSWWIIGSGKIFVHEKWDHNISFSVCRHAIGSAK
jgi:hypothetical protein